MTRALFWFLAALAIFCYRLLYYAPIQLYVVGHVTFWWVTPSSDGYSSAFQAFSLPSLPPVPLFYSQPLG